MTPGSDLSFKQGASKNKGQITKGTAGTQLQNASQVVRHIMPDAPRCCYTPTTITQTDDCTIRRTWAAQCQLQYDDDCLMLRPKDFTIIDDKVVVKTARGDVVVDHPEYFGRRWSSTTAVEWCEECRWRHSWLVRDALRYYYGRLRRTSRRKKCTRIFSPKGNKISCGAPPEEMIDAGRVLWSCLRIDQKPCFTCVVRDDDQAYFTCVVRNDNLARWPIWYFVSLIYACDRQKTRVM